MAIKLRCTLPILVSIILLGTIGIAQAAAPPVSAMAKIGPGVLEQIRDKGSADVMIALEHSQQINPSQYKLGRAPDMAAERSRIARMRSNISFDLAFYAYEERKSYRAVPALAGRIKSEAALSALAHNPHVIKIDLEEGFSGLLENSIPVIAADLRHAVGNTGNGVVVAVIDSGLDTDHDNLSDDLILEVCFADDDGVIDGNGKCPNGSDRQSGAGAAEDDAGHGTHVTGIVTSNGTLGSVGAAPDAGIIAIKVTWGPSFAGVASYYSEIVAAFDYVINNPQLGVQVINMSVGGGGYAGDCDNDGASNIAMAAAINTLRANGVTTFV
ncbi:MAG: S8 family serine peptidase, partial [Xanthomonadales bacterium]|nr:S8 family serine peptidase [Xanthomonadales bacterium]